MKNLFRGSLILLLAPLHLFAEERLELRDRAVICTRYDEASNSCAGIFNITTTGNGVVEARGETLIEMHENLLNVTESQISVARDGKYCVVKIELLDVKSTPDDSELADQVASLTQFGYPALLLSEPCAEYVECEGNQFALTYLNGEFSETYSAPVRIFEPEEAGIEELKLRKIGAVETLAGLDLSTTGCVL